MPDRQVRRRDASGRVRFTDAQWPLPDGRIVVLEVEGGFHMEVTDREIKEAPGRIAASLRAVGVGRSSA